MTIHIDLSAVNWHLWLGIPLIVLLFAFVAFCFRQGMKVKPDTSGSPKDDVSTLIRHPPP